jgi:O-antigen/teichoic acid export membrane protein
MLFASIALLIHLLVRHEISFVRLNIEELRPVLRESRRSGYDFMMIQSVAAFAAASQFAILAYFHGAEAVAPFGIMFQVMLASQAPFITLIQPMWAKVAQLAKIGDLVNIRHLLRTYLKVAAVYSLLPIVFFLFLVNPVLALLLKTSMIMPLDIRVGFALWTVLGLLFGGGLGSIILGMDLTRQMAWISFGQVVVFVAVALAAVPSLAALGVIISVCSGYLVSAPGSLWLLRKSLSSSGSPGHFSK